MKLVEVAGVHEKILECRRYHDMRFLFMSLLKTSVGDD